MFFRKSDKRVPAAQGFLPLAPTKRPTTTSIVPSIISADLVVYGTLESAGDVQIDGRVEGDVRSVRLVIGDEAEIHGDVVADDVTVRGSVQGSIRARRAQFCSTSRVKGAILHHTLVVEIGAQLDCNCRHVDNPLTHELAPKKANRMTAQTASSAIISKSATPIATAIRLVARGLGDVEEATSGTAPLEAPPP